MTFGNINSTFDFGDIRTPLNLYRSWREAINTR